jgi:predicted ATP-grasp superfamily ATP-dependent carboligase
MNTLSVARTLWRMGVPVDVLSQEAADSPVRHSRCVRRRVDVAPRDDPIEAWLEVLLAPGCAPSVVLPCSDHGLELIARHRARLESAGHRPIEAADSVVLALLDKEQTYRLARELGVPTPSTATLSRRSDLDAAGHFSFPAAVKPVNAHVFAQHFGRSPKGTVVRDMEALAEAAGPALDEGLPMLFTEIVEGSDDCCSYYTYLDPGGEPLTHFTKVKLRQYPTRFGLGTYHLTKWDPEVAELGLRFLQGVGLRGMGNVEFKRDERDGVLKIIESNPRFTNAIELVRVSGIDFACLAYARLTELPLPPLDGFRDNIGLWFPIDDIRALREYRSRNELTRLQWARSLIRRQCAPEFALTDPLPSLSNLCRRLARLCRRLAPVKFVARRRA